MTVHDVIRKQTDADDIKIEWNPRTKYCVLTGIEDGKGFYVALPPRTFRALCRRGIIVYLPACQDDCGPEIWTFPEAATKGSGKNEPA